MYKNNGHQYLVDIVDILYLYTHIQVLFVEIIRMSDIVINYLFPLYFYFCNKFYTYVQIDTFYTANLSVY